MELALLHLSDIHFRKGSNPVSARVEKIAATVGSICPTVSQCVVVVSGDIAYSGAEPEYVHAVAFFEDLRKKLNERTPGLMTHLLFVPGNHDCLLPEEEVTVRNALITGVLSSLQTESPDQALVGTLLNAQSNYRDFCRRVMCPPGVNDRIGESVFLEHQNHKIQLNLYNTALTSRRSEQAAELRIPVKYLARTIVSAPDARLSISVFHHSLGWLHPDDALPFRNHIERTSDVVLTGHQHNQDGFYKNNLSGERTLYIEGGALQAEEFSSTSSFQLLFFRLDEQLERSVQYRWSGDIYKVVSDSDWRPQACGRNAVNLRLNSQFEAFLNDIGTPFTHRLKKEPKLRDVFVYPDLMVRGAGLKPTVREVRGEEIQNYVAKTDRIIFQGPGSVGKTSLAKIVFLDLFYGGRYTPILLSGRDIKESGPHKLEGSFWNAFKSQYDPSDLDEFRQLPKARRALLIDNWDRANFNPDGRTAFLETANMYFDKVLLFATDLFQIKELTESISPVALTFEYASIQQLRYGLRGVLIDKWLKLGREHNVQPRDMAREISETENLVSNLIGRNTLPSTPFVVLCILQADQEDKAEAAEAGSFGYLYEVLVTTALSTTVGRKTQLEKKYTFLSYLAYELFKTESVRLSEQRIREIASTYKASYIVTLDVDSLLADLEKARVLFNVQGNYGFAYPHLFHYFLARYYRDNLGRENGEVLREEINHMVDHLSNDKLAATLLFILYFARDSKWIVDRLIANADQIFGEESPADLESDVVFFNEFCTESELKIPETIDLEKNRKERRELKDRVARSADSMTEERSRSYTYSKSLSDSDKFDLAHRHIDLLGQVIRNFPGSLPGPDKLAILRATYSLGLRVLRVVLRLLASSVTSFQGAMAEAEPRVGGRKATKDDLRRINELVAKLVTVLSQVIAFATIKKISGSVGLADLADAYTAVLQQVGISNATQLINLSIRLDHFLSFPEREIRALHSSLEHNLFADSLLKSLIMSHIQVFDIERPLRQSMAALFKVKANAPLLLDQTRKRTKS